MIEAHKSVLIERAFRIYNRQYLTRNFHRVHLDGDLSGLRGDGTAPLLVCVTHSSWWDLLLGCRLVEALPEWNIYTAMDEAQLERYRFFAKMGVIGVDRGSLHGVKEFTSYCKQLLETPTRSLWLTPQGDFVSSSVRPIHFQPGIGVIAQALRQFYITTVAFDYEFWSESRPEAFISVRPMERVVVDSSFNRREFVHAMERKMETHLDELTALRTHRDPKLFTTLSHHRASISLPYDAARRVGAWVQGKPFTQAHTDEITPRRRERKAK